ncbi:LysE family translocator [Streptomyces himalayensis]|jgi:threonine/homoserine/homoserine lactone efflux protein|uniref:LysE family translocator n=1 Tax=Streptomyces himalayensis subsp. himalayensis TaxID=2756131 RepID=A0A7W0DM89_9ACTN|nr:LysE family translocator [Streptomyces himalayensis]MBA2946929.1 LysE family translocator [Streptomyces himalayensis subsp. himalayensis]
MDAQLLAFTGVAAGMVAMPGADFTVVVRNALVSRRMGVACALGIAGGLLFHTALAVAGVAAVLAAVPALFRVLQLMGGAYVLYLGVRTLQSVARPRPAEDAGEEKATAGGGLRQGFLTNALNPKAPITFFSLLPQFVPAGSPAMPRTLLLALIVVVLGLLWFPMVALLVDRLGRWLRRPRAARAVAAVTGTALTALGISLLAAPLMT